MQENLTVQGLIEDLPDEERDYSAPFEDFELPKLGVKNEPESSLPEPAKIGPQVDWTSEQITVYLQAQGKDAGFIASYLVGWHKKPFKK